MNYVDVNVNVLCVWMNYMDVNVLCVWMNYVDANVVYEDCECVWILYCQCFEFSAMELVYPVFVKRNSNSGLIYDNWPS
jgi:hypothetical protein